MNVIVISAVYPPEPFVSARMGHDLATFLTGHGHHVTVLSPQPSRPVSVDYRQYNGLRKPAIACENGITVVRLPSFVAPQSRLVDRVRESYSFGRHVYQYLMEQKEKTDVLYVNAWPLLSQAFVAHYAVRNEVAMVLQIMDIYPESLFNKYSGPAKKLLVTPLAKLDKWIARQAASVVVISENMRGVYTKCRNIPEEQVVIVNVWQDERLFEKSIGRKESCSRYVVPDDLFTFLYLGNIGPVAGVDFLIRAFHDSGLKNAQLLIVGDGSVKQSCIELVGRLEARNIKFISDHIAENVPLLQSMADVCLLPLKSGAGMSSIPSKLPAYLFSAKPVLATVDADSDTAHIIRQSECGWVGDPENLDWLVAKMREIVSLSAQELQTLGERGRKYGLAHFSKAEGVRRLAEVVLSNARKS